MASVIHQTATQVTEAKTALAESLSPSGWKKIRYKKGKEAQEYDQ
ncbi:MAG: hypothetical protein ACI9SG_002210 [Maribacter sp.]|jgi:hypothetical protein